MLTLGVVIEALTDREGVSVDQKITDTQIDSRQVTEGALFVALRGERADGHDFVEQAFVGLTFPVCLRVKNSLEAMQKAAAFWRSKLDLRVIGITGSVGKSTTKELVASVLARRYQTLRSPGNLNNEIGLPLSLLRLTRSHERAVLEMGFYVPGEIAVLFD